MTEVDFEYAAARSVLLDALEALGSQTSCFILVGAQAVYAHTGDVAGTGINRTTDGDLAIDTELLAADPELTSALGAAGFVAGDQPGSWAGTGGVKIDIMTVPHQSNPRSPTSRSARLPSHGTQLARITPGLEAALIDNVLHTVSGLTSDDQRSASVAVAGPAALLVAKTIKIKERNVAVSAGKRDRVKTKDSVDCLRLLTTIHTADLVAGLQRHRNGAEAQAVSLDALAYLWSQLQQGDADEVRRAIFSELDDIVMANSYTALVEELVEACQAAELI